MKKFSFILLIAMFVACVVPIQAKDKAQDICKGMLFFDGEVSKDKTTKQKIPFGQGKLFIKGYRDNNIVDNIAITGDFEGDTVRNAAFYINDKGSCNWNNQYNKYSISQGDVFYGLISYNYSYEKDLKMLYLTVSLVEGKLLCYGSKPTGNVRIMPKDKLQYVISFEKSDRVPYRRSYYVSPTTIRFNSQNSTFAYDDACYALKSLIKDNTYEASNKGDWEIKWIEGKLNNGVSIYSSPEFHKNFSLSGSNGVYVRTDSDSGKLPLSDGGYFSWSGNGNSMRLYFPNGEIFDGSFKKIPFEKDNLSGYSEKNLAVAAKKIMGSASSDYTIETGTYSYPSGKSERVRNGEFIDRKLNNQKHDIKDYYSLISGAKQLSANYDDYLSLCKRNFWEYIGKNNMSELDKALYKKTPEYTVKYQEYTTSLNGLLYEIVSCYASDFTTTGMNVYKNIDLGESAAKSLPLLPIDSKNWWQSALPLKPSCLSSGNDGRIKFPINTTDLDFLIYLQEANDAKELALLCLMKPGATVEYNPYDAIPTAVGLYLINKDTNRVLADLSKYIDTGDPNKYKAIFKQVKAKDKAQRERRENEAMRQYKQRYGNNASPCGACGGTGSLTYWGNGGSYKRVCNQCGGTGRIYKR